MFGDKEKVIRQESQLIKNDEVFKAYENIEEKDEKKHKKDKDKKKKKHERSNKQTLIANVLEKHVRSLKVKEIRPLHLDTMNADQLKDYFKKSKQNFNLRYYDNRPLKRLSSLFTRGTQIKIKEVEDQDIDYYSM